MHPELQSRLIKLENSTKQFTKTIAEANCDVYKSAPHEWSIAQVVEHLLASEGGTLGYMKKKSSGGWNTLEDAGDEHRVAGASIKARLESNERYKAPEVLPEPTNTIELEKLLSKWNMVREELRTFISNIQPEHLNKLVFRQPAAGMLTTLQALEFMDAHIRHHIPQLEKIKNSITQPSK